MMKRLLFLITIACSCLTALGQVNFPRNPQQRNNPTDNNGYPQEEPESSGRKDISVDSMRKQLEAKKDSVIYNATYIKFTKEEFLRDSVKLFPLDTTTKDFHRINPLKDPEHPTMNLGVFGAAYRPMLFEPKKTIGFDMGYHFFDLYMKNPEDIRYFQARSRYTELAYASPFGGRQEELFHVLHTQNIKPNWNMGAYFGKVGSEGYYGTANIRETAFSIMNANLWNWYQSPSKRYTLLANATFNTIRAYETGSILNDSIFTVPTVVEPLYELTRLENDAKHQVRNNSVFIKQFLNIGKQKLLDSGQVALPTQRVSYAFTYNTQKYFFRKESIDESGLLRNYYIYADSTADSTRLNHIKNEFNYSFYVRGKRIAILKNELKLNVGLQQDYYNYRQYNYTTSFQNLTLKGNLNYHFSDRAGLDVGVQQIFQGENAGDFLYEANSELKLSNNVGKILLGVYSQNQSPWMVYERQITNHHRWNNNFERTKTQSASFAYVNPKIRLQAKAEYFLITNYLYFRNLAGDIVPDQLNSDINLLKLSLRKDFKFGKFTFANYLVYQKTDYESIIRTPEIYTFHSFYMHQDFFKVLKTEFGFDVRYFSEYTLPSYAPAIGQFYNRGTTKAETWPVVDAWIRTNWKRANLFLTYNYANKGLQSSGYYTVSQYPMPYSLLQFGLSWNFYD